MGANWSALPLRKPQKRAPYTYQNNGEYNYNPQNKPTTPTSRPAHKVPRVIAFHSTATWQDFFEASKSSNKLVVIDFTATWCGPCQKMAPIFNEFAEKYADVDLVKIDVDELMEVAREFGVQAMPTFLFIKKGMVVDKVVGAAKEELQRKIEKHRA